MSTTIIRQSDGAKFEITKSNLRWYVSKVEPCLKSSVMIQPWVSVEPFDSFIHAVKFVKENLEFLY